jgi:hypothetical protein
MSELARGPVEDKTIMFMEVQAHLRQKILDMDESTCVQEVLFEELANAKTEEEVSLHTLLQDMFLTAEEVTSALQVADDEVGKRIVAKLKRLVTQMSERSKITFGEKRYMEGLLEGIAECGERRREFEVQEQMLRNALVDLAEIKCSILSMREDVAMLTGAFNAFLPALVSKAADFTARE